MKPRGRWRGRVAVIALGDAVVTVVTFVAIVLFRRYVQLPGTIGLLPAYNVPLTWPWFVTLACAALVALYLVGTYDEPAASVKERGGLLVASIVTAGFLVGAYFVVGRGVPRTVLFIHLPVLYVGLELWRSLAEKLVPIGVRPVLVLGSGEDARRAAEALERGEITGHSLLEWQQDLSHFRGVSGETDPNIPGVPEGALDVVFASDLPVDRDTLVTLLERSLKHDFDLWILPGITDIVASRVVTRSLGDLPLTPVETRGSSLLARAIRRAIDLSIGGALLVVTAPILLVASVAVALESPGRPWLKQKRVGLGGKSFDIWKVRTMRPNAEEETGPTLADRDDDRFTRVGRLLRKMRVDELPQLLLIVGGTMSLIGPRPERPEFVANYAREVPAYRLRHLMKPGLTGLAQVMGAYATKPDVKLRYDLGYLFHWNPFVDLFILVRTIATVFKGSGV